MNYCCPFTSQKNTFLERKRGVKFYDLNPSYVFSWFAQITGETESWIKLSIINFRSVLLITAPIFFFPQTCCDYVLET